MSDTDATKPAEATIAAAEDQVVEQPEVTEEANGGVEVTEAEDAEEAVEEAVEEAAEGETDEKVEEKDEDAEAEAKEDAKNDSESKDEEAAEEEKQPEKDILKTTAKIDYKNHKNNRKFDPSVREISDDPVAIRKQVEFYFGDWNYPQDKFMWESGGGSENKPIAIGTLHSFKRMRCFQPYSAVVAALRESSFLEVSGEEGKEVVKRKVAYQPMPSSKAKSEAATVYVKGFGDEKPDTQFDLESFFAQYGEVKGLKLRRTTENLFKGSVFVTFIDEESAKKFIETDPAPKWNDHDLKIMSKQAYCEEKSELIKQGKLEPNGATQKKFYEGRESKGSRGRGRDGKDGGRDPNDWKKRRDHDQKNGFRNQRGGNGRGRGGRGRGFGNRGGRDGRRDRDREGQEKRVDAAHTKRSREDDDASGAPAAKKVDVKDD